MLEWPPMYTESILEAIRSAASTCVGMPVAFSCVQACSDWFESLEKGDVEIELNTKDQIEANAEALPAGNDAETSLSDEEIIQMATKAAAAAAAKTLKGLSPSRKGLWKYKVGLVGKPSAGKSTLFNALTKSDAAAIGAFPFTTIEPNVGVGFYSSVAEGNHGERGAYYGRHVDGGRLLPVVIKDVAGLVPGAYAGRGKGNQFLNDLVDCDVLIHVVDASGRSTKDGNILQSGSVQNAEEDAKWVRLEIHRWIADNVEAKMESVKSHNPAARFKQLLSGYAASPNLIERIASQAGFKLEECRAWTRLERHTFIAHFVYARFPICLALNKVDCINDRYSEVASLVKGAEARGERAVPCSARTECARLDGVSSKLVQSTIDVWGCTGTMKLMSAAISMKPPVLVYPVDDLESEAAIGNAKPAMPLLDCLQFYPGSTVEDVYNVLLWSQSNVDGRLRFRPKLQLRGDFIRADCRGLDAQDDTGRRSKQVSRKHVVDCQSCVLKICTTR